MAFAMLADLGVIAVVLTIGVAFLPSWSAVVLLAIGLVIAVGFAFTPTGLLGEVFVVAAVVGLTLRGGLQVARCFRRHRGVATRLL